MQEHFETQKLGDTKKDNKSFLLFKKGKEILMRPKGLSLRWKPCIILGIAALHYIATGISITVSFGLGMSRFDSGTNPSLGEQALDILAHILVFPLVSATPSGVPQPIQFA